MKFCLFLILFTLLSAFAFAQSGSSFSGDSNKKMGYIEQVANGETLLPFRMISLEADDVDYAGFYGKMVVINVWSTWSKPSVALLHSFDSISKLLSNDTLEFVKVSVDHNLDDWFSFSDTLPMSENHFWVGDSYRNSMMWFSLESVEISQTENVVVSTLPRFVIVGPDGTIKNNNASLPNTPEFIDEIMK